MAAALGERLFYPPTVAGWPTGLDWLRRPTLLARAEFASKFAGSDSFASVSKKYGLDRADAWADILATLILGARRAKTPNGGRSPAAIVRGVLSAPEAQLA